MSFEWFHSLEPVTTRAEQRQSSDTELQQINAVRNDAETRQSPEWRIIWQIDKKSECVENLAISATNERFAAIHTNELVNRTQELASLRKEFNIGMQIAYPGINLQEHWWHQLA
jgi:hypothetical protein